MLAFCHLAVKNHLLTGGSKMKLAITALSRADFGVIVNSDFG